MYLIIEVLLKRVLSFVSAVKAYCLVVKWLWADCKMFCMKSTTSSSSACPNYKKSLKCPGDKFWFKIFWVHTDTGSSFSVAFVFPLIRLSPYSPRHQEATWASGWRSEMGREADCKSKSPGFPSCCSEDGLLLTAFHNWPTAYPCSDVLSAMICIVLDTTSSRT